MFLIVDSVISLPKIIEIIVNTAIKTIEIHNPTAKKISVTQYVNIGKKIHDKI